MKPFKDYFKRLSKSLRDALYPQNITCDCCGKDIFKDSNVAVCDDCLETLPFIHNPCNKCGKDLFGTKCNFCLKNKLSFSKAFAVFNYASPISEMIVRLKFGKAFYLKDFFTHFLVMKFLGLAINPDCVVGVPMHPKKEHSRRINHARLLAEEFSKRTNIPNASNLVRKTAITTQSNLTDTTREENLKNTLFIRDVNYFKNKEVLIIDDIFTTGATANSMSQKLFEYGAKKVYILTICTSY